MNLESRPKNLAALFSERVKLSGDKTAIQFKQNGTYRDVSYREFADTVRGLAFALKQRGVQKGDRIALLSENRPEWFYTDLATLSLGAVTVPIYPTNSPKECRYILEHTQSKIMFVSTSEQRLRLESEFKQCPNLKEIIQFDLSFLQLIEEGKKIQAVSGNFLESEIEKILPDDLATLIYTSGTTGEPKGVMLSHGNLISNCEASLKAIGIRYDDVLLSILPLSHVFERMAGFYLQIYAGSTVAFAENMKTAAENLPEVRPTIMNAVPRFFEKLQENILAQIKSRGVLAEKLFWRGVAVGEKISEINRMEKNPPVFLFLAWEFFRHLIFSKIKKKLGGRLRFFISGGAPLPKDLSEFFHAIDILILEGYGLTETSPVISVNRENRFRFGSVGILLENVRLKIEKDGEIWVSGPNIMEGYYKNWEATNGVIQDGWFATGDVGRLDSQGFLYITDRKKDLIKTSGGKYISPQKVERLLTVDDWIEQAFIYGDQRKFIVALIVPSFSKLESFAAEKNIPFSSRRELLENVQLRKDFDDRVRRAQVELAEFEKVKYYSILPEEMTLETGELTPTLKMKRRVVIEKHRDLIEKMYQEADRFASK